MAEKYVNFTKKVIESLPHPYDKYVMYHDEKTPGLVMRVYPSGVKSFFLYRWTSGKPEYISLGRYPAVFPEQARRRAAELNSEIGAGRNPAEMKRRIKAEISLGELFEKYLTLHARKHKRPKSVINDKSLYRLYFSQWQNRTIPSISRREVQTLLNRIGDENGPYQANRTRALLHTLYEKALEWGYVGTNPCFKLKKFPERSRERFLQKDELLRFFQGLQESPEMESDFFSLLLFTGARKSNVLSMSWKDINLDLQLWNIPSEQSKNKIAYTVPLVTSAVDILRRRGENHQETPWVFPYKSKTGHLQEPKHAWTRILKKANLEDLRIHDLRRTIASWMAITGASEYVIKGALGHKTMGQGVTGIYARLNVDPIRAAMETAVRTMLRKGGMIPDEENVIEFKESV